MDRSTPRRTGRRQRANARTNDQEQHHSHRRPQNYPQHFLLTLLVLATSPRITHGGSNNYFCGTSWTDASSNCDIRQPCPLGTDDECTSPSNPGATCWADTSCDTDKGDGILFITNHPQHNRFCGNSWNDAQSNCSVKRHCPSGDNRDCPEEQDCYSFLPGCNYAEMAVIPINTGGGGGGGGADKMAKDDPVRNNWCGSNWNDAQDHCDDLDYWCPSGSDGDCPSGTSCFGGVGCRYEEDIFPTGTPTLSPSKFPTLAPIPYNLPENSKFCGFSWTDASLTCRIDTHCPSGSSSDCHTGQECFGGFGGCNIVDMLRAKAETGVEIYGFQKLPITDDVTFENGPPSTPPPVATDQPTFPEPTISPFLHASTEVPPTPSSLSQKPPSQSYVSQEPPISPPLSQNPPTPSSINKAPANGFDANNHIFCGNSWQNAQDRCSPETFCLTGATYKCEKLGDLCYPGIMACNAADWVPTYEPTFSPIISTMAPTESPSLTPTAAPTLSPATPYPTHKPTSRPTPGPSPNPTSPSMGQASTTLAPTKPSTQDKLDRYSVRQSYCATNYSELISECATLDTCNHVKKCPKDQFCFANVLCPKPKKPPTSLSVPSPAGPPEVKTLAPTTFAPTTYAPTTYAPTTYLPATSTPVTSVPTTLAPVTSVPTTLAPVTSVPTTLDPVTSVPTTLDPVTSVPTTLDPVTSVPTTLNPIASVSITSIPKAPVLKTSIPTTYAPTIPASSSPTMGPTILTLTPQEVAKRFTSENNYCGRNFYHVVSSCSFALQTCNEDDSPCPQGTYCFGSILCKPQVPPTSSPIMIPTKLPTYVPTLFPTTEPTLSPSHKPSYDISINTHRQNYCAQSFEQIQLTCARAPTCNRGDEPCPTGTSCFPAVICEATQKQTTISPIQNKPQEAPSKLFTVVPMDRPTFEPTAPPVALLTQRPITISPTVDECDHLCLMPIDSADCSYVMSLNLRLLPCSAAPGIDGALVHVGDLCVGTAKCGTSLDLNNCPYNQDIYIRLDSDQCKNHDNSGSGVLPPVGPAVGMGSGELNSGELNSGELNSGEMDSGNEAASTDKGGSPMSATINSDSAMDDIVSTGYVSIDTSEPYQDDDFNIIPKGLAADSSVSAAPTGSKIEKNKELATQPPTSLNDKEFDWRKAPSGTSGNQYDGSGMAGWWLEEKDSASSGSYWQQQLFAKGWFYSFLILIHRFIAH